jgi:hypothetical protein
MLKIVRDRLVGQIAQPVVVTAIADVGSKFRLRAQRVFPLIGKQAIEFRSPRFQRLIRSVSQHGN